MKFVLNILVICSFYSVQAQSINVAGIFPTIDHSGTITNKLDYGIYYFAALPLVNLKNPNLSKDNYFHLLYLEQALTYKKSENLSFTASYLYQRENVSYSNYVNENRIYLQAKFKQNFTKFKLTHRFRFDGRFVQNRITSKSPFTSRVRYLIGFDKDLSDKYYLTLYEEAFFSTVNKAAPVYNENWAYLGLGKKLNVNNKIELGILHVTWNIGEKNWFNQYYLQFTWINHINFKKEQK